MTNKIKIRSIFIYCVGTECCRVNEVTEYSEVHVMKWNLHDFTAKINGNISANCIKYDFTAKINGNCKLYKI